MCSESQLQAHIIEHVRAEVANVFSDNDERAIWCAVLELFFCNFGTVQGLLKSVSKKTYTEKKASSTNTKHGTSQMSKLTSEVRITHSTVLWPDPPSSSSGQSHRRQYSVAARLRPMALDLRVKCRCCPSDLICANTAGPAGRTFPLATGWSTELQVDVGSENRVRWHLEDGGTYDYGRLYSLLVED